MSRSRVAAAVVLVATVTAACFQSPAVVPPSKAGPALRYVAIGASESVGIGTADPLRDAWTQVFYRTALPRGATFVNLGIPGATVARALQDELPYAVSLRPDVVTVWLNVNDAVAGVSAGTYERELATLVDALRRAGARTILVANIPPLTELPAYQACRPSPPPGAGECRLHRILPPPEVIDRDIAAYNRAIARVARAAGAVVVDLHALGESEERNGSVARFVGPDGFHPNAEGAALVARSFAAAYRRACSRTPRTC